MKVKQDRPDKLNAVKKYPEPKSVRNVPHSKRNIYLVIINGRLYIARSSDTGTGTANIKKTIAQHTTNAIVQNWQE